MNIFAATIILLTLVAFGTRCSRSDPNESVFAEYQFPSRAGLTHLCQQRVYGSGREITWNAFASAETPAELIDYYRRKLGDAGFEKDGEGGMWRRPADAPQPRKVLDIRPANADGPHRQCDKSPPANTRSILMLSKMY